MRICMITETGAKFSWKITWSKLGTFPEAIRVSANKTHCSLKIDKGKLLGLGWKI